MEQSIGVFGEEMLLWMCMLRQAARRPAAEHVHRQANFLLDELKASPLAQSLPVQSVDDGMFAIAVLLDEVAMSLPDLRPLWAQSPLQATRWMTNNGGVELFARLDQRVRQGPKSILATYAVVLGIGFQGRFGLPGADRYALAQLRRQISIGIGVDPDRDWKAGVLKPVRADAGPSSLLPKDPWYKRVAFGRVLMILLLLGSLGAMGAVLYGRFG